MFCQRKLFSSSHLARLAEHQIYIDALDVFGVQVSTQIKETAEGCLLIIRSTNSMGLDDVVSHLPGYDACDLLGRLS